MKIIRIAKIRQCRVSKKNRGGVWSELRVEELKMPYALYGLIAHRYAICTKYSMGLGKSVTNHIPLTFSFSVKRILVDCRVRT